MRKLLFLLYPMAIYFIACNEHNAQNRVGTRDSITANTNVLPDSDLIKLRVAPAEARSMRENIRGVNLLPRNELIRVSVSVGDLINILNQHLIDSQNLNYSDSVLFYFARYKGNDSEGNRYKVKHKGQNIPGNVNDRIKNNFTLLMSFKEPSTTGPSTKNQRLYTLSKAVYDFGRICPPPTGCD